MKLITEEISNAEYIVEETNGKKNYSIKGVFMQSDVKNRNGRIYPKEILQKEVDRYNREFIQKNRAFGELGHPDGSDSKFRKSFAHDQIAHSRTVIL